MKLQAVPATVAGTGVPPFRETVTLTPASLVPPICWLDEVAGLVTPFRVSAGGVVSIVYTAVCGASLFPALSTAKNCNVVSDAIWIGAVYFADPVVGGEPSVV